jgi:uncharacterized protein YprB with RNaseH-like and TPR domain
MSQATNQELFARLARLRREERGREAESPGSAVLPEWFTSRRAAAPSPLEGETDLAGRTAGPPERLVEHTNARGSFASREELYGADHGHGDWCLAEVLAARAAELAWLAKDGRLEELDPARCVYLDIETTGLAGGAGTIPFLVALGRFEDGAFRLWQAFLRDPGEEAAALAEVAERIRAARGVVSFFGKSFDRHRLEDKMRLHGIAPPFAEQPHLDLYHPLRRLYRGAFLDGRLATFERELCGVERVDDLPGAFAPLAWLEFLGGRAHRLEAVFRHNELDVLSLVVLGAHLARTRTEVRGDGRALGGCGRARARAVAELHSARREHSEALEWLERGLVRAGSDEGGLWFRHAECLRRLGQRERALDEFLRLARERRDALGARAWAATLPLARRLKRADVEREALAHGPEAAERTLTGRARARTLAVFARSSAGASS